MLGMASEIHIGSFSLAGELQPLAKSLGCHGNQQDCW